MEDVAIAYVLGGLVVGALCAWGASRIAREKGHSPETWALLGFFFGVLALLVIGLMPPATASASGQRRTRTCPDCAEEIQMAALVCRYCGHRFSADEVQSATRAVDLQYAADALKEQLSNASDLIQAAVDDDLDTIRFMLDEGLSPDLTDLEGRTALMVSAALGHSKVVRVLLRAGANPELMSKSGDSAISLASSEGRNDVLGLLTGTPRVSRRLVHLDATASVAAS